MMMNKLWMMIWSMNNDKWNEWIINDDESMNQWMNE